MNIFKKSKNNNKRVDTTDNGKDRKINKNAVQQERKKIENIFFEIEEKEKEEEEDDDDEYITYIPPIIKYDNKKLVFLLIENTQDMKQSMSHIRPIVEKNINLGEDIISYPIIYSSEVKTFSKFSIDEILVFDNNTNNANLSKTVDFVLEFMEDLSKHNMILKLEDKTVKVTDVEIRCIGTGKDDPNSSTAMVTLNELMKKYNINTKYFCVYDMQCCDAAAFGFNIIGHIVNNFYS